ncbi:hypothetical protein LSM04_002844 [Trypanosoma melophagium]|uniref:uncharacterized protein n=1 Tax=Trypanosoma melophagium TaxID=715481 RepID=UPI00351A04F7|nr:hypothetical protein LSM04_002844 [Trypanosoma melophagium]
MPQNPRMRIRLIGPSGHKSEYHCATLLGNWQEERTSFGLRDPGKAPLDDETIYKTSYKGTSSEEELFTAKPPGCFCAEAPPQLLFYHGDIASPPQSQLTVQELSYTDPTTGEERLKLKDILEKEGISTRREKTEKIRRTMGLRGFSSTGAASATSTKGMSPTGLAYIQECSLKADKSLTETARSGGYTPPPIPPIGRIQEKERMLTTKNVTIDVTGEYLKDNIDKYPATSSECWGMFMAYQDDPMQRTKLREDYELK